MMYALLGREISHSLSPAIYRRLLGDRLERYDLLDYKSEGDIPDLRILGQKYHGLNITSPYKRHFFSQINVTSEIARKMGAINTISLSRMEATNTDALATEQILRRFLAENPALFVVLLGNGVMGKMTVLLLEKLGISYQVLSRSQLSDLANLDLTSYYFSERQTLVINSCSRQFEYRGRVHQDFIFWDYNYNFSPHSMTLPTRLKSYIDGTEMLELQAQEAVRFWLRG